MKKCRSAPTKARVSSIEWKRNGSRQMLRARPADSAAYCKTSKRSMVGCLNCAKNGDFVSGFLINADNFHHVVVK